MVESFFSYSKRDRHEALVAAASASGRPPHLLEKDVWVVWALAVLFEAPFGKHLVFKGGTSLSKAYGAIRRFSEDVDITYDIRQLIPELVEGTAEALPKNRSQQKKWTRELQARLPNWIRSTVLPTLEENIEQRQLPATARIEDDFVLVDYEAGSIGTGYVRPSVLLEFGARSTGEPCEVRKIACDAARYLAQVSFPEAAPRVMRVERTFWEKATAAHVFCLQQRQRGERFARH